MPNVYTVSAIGNKLSGIIKNESTFQEVSVTGKVSVDNLLGVFWLTDAENKIRCFIPGNKRAKFGSLLEAENTVVVNGRITLFPSESEYQILVADVIRITNLPKVNQQLTVSGITANLSRLIQNSSDLQGIQVHGNISNFDSNFKRTFWFLSDTNIVNPQRVHCVFFEVDGMAVGNGDQIQAEGNIQIWGAHSRYQINIAEVQLDDGPPRCECLGCGSCQEIGAAPQCSALPDPKYELCSLCYAASPDHEKRVEEAVEIYFSNLKVKGFSPKTQHKIQIGTENRSPDVVLIDENGSFAVIAECKGAGFVGDGREQLYSYLSATDTRFGVFANRADSNDWEFYENRRRNQFDRITSDQFQDGIVKGITLRKQLKDQIKILESDCNQSRATIGDLSNEIDQLRTTKIQLKTEIGHLEQQKRELYASRKQWKEKIQQFETFLADLKSDLLDSEPALLSDNSVDPQKIRGDKKQGIMNKLKNLFSKENE